MDSRESFRPGPADQLVQHCLGLVVEGVCGCDPISQAGGKELGEPAITQGARCLFKPRARAASEAGRVHILAVQPKSEPFRKRFDKGGIEVGLLATDAVMHVSHAQYQAQARPGIRLDQRPQQRDRISPARHGDGDTHAR